MNSKDTNVPSSPARFLWALWRFCSQFVLFLFLAVLLYLAIALIGLIPINTKFVSPPENDSIKIFVRSSGVHADLILPVSNQLIDWRTTFPDADFKGRTLGMRYVAFGWGDRGFYLGTPTWNDLTFAKCWQALLVPSDSVMHVTFTRPVESADCRSVRISKQQYEQLVAYIVESFDCDVTNDMVSSLERNQYRSTKPAATESATGESIPRFNLIPKAVDAKFSYAWNDRFYEANGSYHIFRTCNCWVGRGLQAAGVRTAWFTPLPRSVFVHWPEKPAGWHWLVPPPGCWFGSRRKSTSTS